MNSIEQLIDVDLAQSLALSFGVRLPKFLTVSGSGKRMPASVLHHRVMESSDPKVLRAACLVLRYAGIEWEELSQKILKSIADEKTHDVFYEMLLAHSAWLCPEDRKLFLHLMKSVQHDVLGTALIVLCELDGQLNEVERARIIGEAERLVKTGSFTEWDTLCDLVDKEESCVVKALSSTGRKAISRERGAGKVLCRYGVVWWRILRWFQSHGHECTEELAVELGFSNKVWTSEQKSVWKTLKGVKPVSQTENLRWCLEQGVAAECRVPLDSNRCLQVLEDWGDDGVTILRNSLKNGKRYLDSARVHSDLFEKAFSVWDEGLLPAYQELKDCIVGCEEYQAAVSCGTAEAMKWADAPVESKAFELALAEPVEGLEDKWELWNLAYGEQYLNENGVKGKVLAILGDECEGQIVDPDWCAELQYWVIKHGDEAREWAENIGCWVLNGAFKQLGFWNGELHTELIDDDWNRDDLETAVTLAWGKEAGESAESLPWGIKFNQLPGVWVLDSGEWYSNWCRAVGPELPENWELVQATNGEVPLRQLKDWDGVEGEDGYRFLGADFWRDWKGGSLLGLPKQFVKKFATNPKFLESVVERWSDECRVLQPEFWQEIDPTEWQEFPEQLFEEGSVARIGWSPEFVELLDCGVEEQQVRWDCCGKVLPEEFNWQLVKSSAILGARLDCMVYDLWFANRKLSTDDKVVLISYPFYWTDETLKYWELVVKLGICGPVEEAGYAIMQKLGMYWLNKEQCCDGKRIFELWKSGKLELVAKEYAHRYGEWAQECRSAIVAWLNGCEWGRKSRFLAGVGDSFEFDEAVSLAKKMSLNGDDFDLMVLNLLDEAWRLEDGELYRFYPTEDGALEVLEFSFMENHLTVCESRECWVGLGRVPQIHLVNGAVANVWDGDQIALV